MFIQDMNPVEFELEQLPRTNRSTLRQLKSDDPDLFGDLARFPIECRTSALKAMALRIEEGMAPRFAYLVALGDLCRLKSFARDA